MIHYSKEVRSTGNNVINWWVGQTRKESEAAEASDELSLEAPGKTAVNL
jgi:hypothetical protein